MMLDVRIKGKFLILSLIRGRSLKREIRLVK